MGIGNKPCLDIRPSADQISDRSVSIAQLSKGNVSQVWVATVKIVLFAPYWTNMCAWTPLSEADCPTHCPLGITDYSFSSSLELMR